MFNNCISCSTCCHRCWCPDDAYNELLLTQENMITSEENWRSTETSSTSIGIEEKITQKRRVVKVTQVVGCFASALAFAASGYYFGALDYILDPRVLTVLSIATCNCMTGTACCCRYTIKSLCGKKNEHSDNAPIMTRTIIKNEDPPKMEYEEFNSKKEDDEFTYVPLFSDNDEQK